METWILRFPSPRRKASDRRQLMVLRRSSDGAIEQLETLQIEGGHANLPTVVETQAAQGRTRLVLDLLHEERLDSNDLAQLIGAMKYAEDAGGKLIFANPTPRVTEIFQLTHLNDVMAVYDSIAAAADHFATPE